MPVYGILDIWDPGTGRGEGILAIWNPGYGIQDSKSSSTYGCTTWYM
eukprot:SAG11_NODE_422_length_9597_cov_11.289488_3_plen_47_part_00